MGELKKNAKKVGKFLLEVAQGDLGQVFPKCRKCGKKLKEIRDMYNPHYQCTNKKCLFYGLMYNGDIDEKEDV